MIDRNIYTANEALLLAHTIERVSLRVSTYHIQLTQMDRDIILLALRHKCLVPNEAQKEIKK